MTIEYLKNYLVDEAEYTIEEVEDMDSYDLVNAYLRWNGIINYTDDIINVVFAAYKVDVDELY